MLKHAQGTAVQESARNWAAPRPLSDAMKAANGHPDLAVDAYANHGRWVVECPDCHGAQFASRTDPRFMCNCCANAAVGGVWRLVRWPKDRAAIESVLEPRRAENQNWKPGETVEQLAAENDLYLKGGL